MYISDWMIAFHFGIFGMTVLYCVSAGLHHSISSKLFYIRQNTVFYVPVILILLVRVRLTLGKLEIVKLGYML